MPDITRNTFAPHINQQFSTVDPTGAEVILTLVELTPPEEASDPATEAVKQGTGNRGFTLLFRAPPGSQMQQQIYELCHPELGPRPIFLVPVAADNEGVYLEAVFN